MDAAPNRRRVLQATGVAGLASLAGCSQLRSQDDSPADGNETEDTGDSNDTEYSNKEPTIDPEDGIAAVVEPSEEGQAELAALRQELGTKIQDDEISQQEAQAQLQQRQLELTIEAVTEFESYVADAEGLSVAGSIGEYGLILLEGDDGPLVATLEDDAVSALLPGGRFAEVQSQQVQQGQQGQQDQQDQQENSSENSS